MNGEWESLSPRSTSSCEIVSVSLYLLLCSATVGSIPVLHCCNELQATHFIQLKLFNLVFIIIANYKERTEHLSCLSLSCFYKSYQNTGRVFQEDHSVEQQEAEEVLII